MLGSNPFNEFFTGVIMSNIVVSNINSDAMYRDWPDATKALLGRKPVLNRLVRDTYAKLVALQQQNDWFTLEFPVPNELDGIDIQSSAGRFSILCGYSESAAAIGWADPSFSANQVTPVKVTWINARKLVDNRVCSIPARICDALYQRDFENTVSPLLIESLNTFNRLYRQPPLPHAL